MPTPNTFTWLDGLLRGSEGDGDVTGPVSSFAGHLVSFADTSGKVLADSGIAASSLILANGSVAMAANLNMGSHKITNVTTPTNAGDAANKSYVDGLVGSAVTADGITLQLISSVMSVKNNGVGNAQLRAGAACSIVGRSLNSGGNVADIAINEGETLVRTSGVLASAKIATANIAAAAAIALSQLASGSALALVGRDSASPGAYADIVAGVDGHVMRRAGSAIGFGAIDLSNAATVGASKVPLANQPDGAACSVRGRSVNSIGVVADIGLADDELLMRTASVLVSGKVSNANVATGAAIAGSKIAPAFGAQNVTSSNYFGGIDNAAIGGTGDAITFRAGDATGPSGTRTGGAVTLRSGTGSSASGNLTLQRGSTVVAQWTNSASDFLSLGNSPALTGAGLRMTNNTFVWGRTTVASDVALLGLNNGDGVILGNTTSATVINGVSGASNGIRLLIGGSPVFNVGTTITMFTSVFTWDASQASPVISQNTDVSATTTGDLFAISAQDCSGTTSVTAGAMTLRAGDATGASGTRNGGALTLRSGTGATAPGTVQILAGALNLFDYGVTAAGNLHIGNTTSQLVLNAINSGIGMTIRLGGNDRTTWSNTQQTWYVSNALFTLAQSAPILGQETATAATVTGQQLTVTAQDASGTTAVTAGALLIKAGDATGASGTRNGGALTLRSGTGVTANGNVTIKRGSVDVLTATAAAGMTTTLGSAVGPVILSAGGAIDYSVYMITNGATRHQFALSSVDFDDLNAGSTGNNNMDLLFQGVQFMRMRRESGVSKMSFFGATAVAKPTVTGSRGGNAALASALTALASLGLLVDSSS